MTLNLPQSEEIERQVVVEGERAMMALNRPREYRGEKSRACRLGHRPQRHRQPVQRRSPRWIHRVVRRQRNVDKNLQVVASGEVLRAGVEPNSDDTSWLIVSLCGPSPAHGGHKRVGLGTGMRDAGRIYSLRTQPLDVVLLRIIVVSSDHAACSHARRAKPE